MTGKVGFAYVHDGHDVTYSFLESFNSLALYDAGGPQNLFGVPNPLAMLCGGDGLPAARNRVAQQILDGPYEWLFWIDSDMGFAPDTVEQLLAVADPVDRPIVGGLCFLQRVGARDGYGGFVTSAHATIMDWHSDRTPRGFTNRPWYEPNTLTRCDGTGSACVLIHRTALEKIRDEYGPEWYSRALNDDILVAEDLSFCMRAMTVGVPVHVHTGVKTTHMKTVWLSDREFWNQQTAPPATEPTAVLVPVLDRPQNARPFMDSLRASTGLATVYAICGEDDVETWGAWKEAGAQVIAASQKPFAVKINDGYRTTTEPWLFIVGDDVRFHPGWLDHAQFAATITGKHVIGTNDLGNPRVMRGEHATHLLIRRTYIDDTGASWDGPRVVCHEGYRHWYVDDELVTAAKQRDVWTMALGSKVEHLHPIWGKAEQDDTYRLGQHYSDRDGRLFKKRLAANG